VFSVAFGLSSTFGEVRAALLWRALLQALRPPRNIAAGGVAALTSRHVPQALAFAALSGCGLALVTPCVTSVIADLWEERVRGRAFGVVLMFGSLGARPVPRAAADLRA
jgi:MFS family permease